MTELHSVIRRNKRGSLHCPCTSARPQAESRATKQLNPPAKVRLRTQTHTRIISFVICVKFQNKLSKAMNCSVGGFTLAPILYLILYARGKKNIRCFQVNSSLCLFRLVASNLISERGNTAPICTNCATATDHTAFIHRLDNNQTDIIQYIMAE